MKIGKISVLIGIFILQLVACADPDLAPILTFDNSGKGAYIRLIEESTRSLNYNDLANTAYTYSVEFVDIEKGAQVQEYTLELTFTDKTPANGNSSKGPIKFKSFTSFVDTPNGYKGVLGIKITAKELIDAVGLKTENVSATDVFSVVGSITLKDGSVFKKANSSATVQGSAFKSHFDYALALVCPSALAGTYIATTTGTSTDDCCKGAPVTLKDKTVTLTDKGGGIYEISDWSVGLYLQWYAVYGITATTNLKANITDVCGTISGSFDEPFGSKVAVTGTASGGVITYTWKNGYDDTATVTLTKK